MEAEVKQEAPQDEPVAIAQQEPKDAEHFELKTHTIMLAMQKLEEEQVNIRRVEQAQNLQVQ